MAGEILVSICSTTYNHAPYIRQCLDGFLMQQVNFKYEILIHDDASTDGTDEIIKEYAAKYPDIIKPLYEEVNQYSTDNPKGMAYWNFSRAKGKYIAMCEGDDYWTDPLKLQKQVDFLERHTDYVLCTHHFFRFDQNVACYYENNSTIQLEDFTYDIDYYIKYNNWVTQPLTSLFRLDSLCLLDFMNLPIKKDTVLFYEILKNGKGLLMKEPMGVYRIHSYGVWTGIEPCEQSRSNILAIKSIYVNEESTLAAKYLYNCLLCHGYLGLTFFKRYMDLFIQVMFIIFKNFGLRLTFKLILKSIIFAK